MTRRSLRPALLAACLISPLAAAQSAPPTGTPAVQAAHLTDERTAKFEARLQKKYGATLARVYRMTGGGEAPHLALLLVKPAFYKAPHVILDADAQLSAAAHEHKVADLLQRYEPQLVGVTQEVLNAYSLAEIGSELGLQISNENKGGQELTVNAPAAYLKTLLSRPLDPKRAATLKRELNAKYAPQAVKLAKVGGQLLLTLNAPNFYKAPNVIETRDLNDPKTGAAKIERLKKAYDAPLQDVLRGAVNAFGAQKDVRAFVVRLGHLSGGQWVYLDLTVPREEALRIER